jgi:thymidylate synthase (FAD)
VRAVVLEHGDWSVVEHASVSVDAVVDRGVQQEWTRHRLFSYTIESTRFVNYEKKMPASCVMPDLFGGDALYWFDRAINSCEDSYRGMIAAGVKPQIARSVLPLSLASRMVVTGNLRTWRHFFLMRTTREAHPQIREVAEPLLDEFKSKIPLIYDDIVPGARQVDNVARAK